MMFIHNKSVMKMRPCYNAEPFWTHAVLPHITTVSTEQFHQHLWCDQAKSV